MPRFRIQHGFAMLCLEIGIPDYSGIPKNPWVYHNSCTFLLFNNHFGGSQDTELRLRRFREDGSALACFVAHKITAKLLYHFCGCGYCIVSLLYDQSLIVYWLCCTLLQSALKMNDKTAHGRVHFRQPVISAGVPRTCRQPAFSENWVPQS